MTPRVLATRNTPVVVASRLPPMTLRDALEQLGFSEMQDVMAGFGQYLD
jgi:hypothetical protein